MRRLLFVFSVAGAWGSPVESTAGACLSDPDSEECSIRVELLQSKIEITKSSEGNDKGLDSQRAEQIIGKKLSSHGQAVVSKRTKRVSRGQAAAKRTNKHFQAMQERKRAILSKRASSHGQAAESSNHGGSRSNRTKDGSEHDKGHSSHGQTTYLSSYEMQALMGIGINLGNRYDLWGTEDKWKPTFNTGSTSTGDLPRTVTETDFDEFAANGFTNVRIPVCWHWKTALWAGQTDTSFPIDTDYMNSVEKMVDWALAAGLVVILDTHHEEWLDIDGFPAGSDDPIDGMTLARGLSRFEAIWTQIGERFKNKDENLLFEVFNEPHKLNIYRLKDIYDVAIPAIRAENPNRIILLQGLSYGNPKWIIEDSDASKIGAYFQDDNQTMLAVHKYDPWNYAGGPVPSVYSWTYANDFATMTAWMDDLDAWASTYNVPIYLGEFGVTNYQTGDNSSSNGGDAWFTWHAQEITSRGWGASVWNDGSGHLIYDYDDNSWDADILWDLGRLGTTGTKNKRCCFGGTPTCGTMTSCYDSTGDTNSWCGTSWANCESKCGGKWCTNQNNAVTASND